MDIPLTTNGSSREGNDQFEPFDLTIYLGPENIPWISATSRIGAVHGIPRSVDSLPSLPEMLDLVYDYSYDIQFAEARESEFTQILAELVFGDREISQLFQATRGVAADRGKQVLFRILASPHLAVLPWELLRDPARHDQLSYLALAPDIHLVRHARGRTYPTRNTLLEAPLNLLLVLSSPRDESDRDDALSFDIFEVKRNLLSELAPLERDGLLRIDVEDSPTIDNLRRRIGSQRRGYHLFHYVGHALPDGLIIEDRAGNRENLSGERLSELLQLCPDLRLAVFAGCETARPATDPLTVDTRQSTGGRDLLSLSDYCVQKACPVVIGMQAVLPFSTERIFTRFFYQALVSGYTAAESLRLARGAIQADTRVGGKLLDWSVPSLFVGSGEPGAIVPRTATATKVPSKQRTELNLGLRQGNERFFGRDLPLRQAVDVIAGRTRERVLIVTGAAGVGKTSLIDRALEEVGNTVSDSLFINFSHLLFDAQQDRRTFAAGKFPDIRTLAELKEDAVLERLCRWSNELMLLGGVTVRDKDANWTANDWWERVIEDIVRRQFVLVIDDFGALDQLQLDLLERLINPVLSAWVAERRKRENVTLHRDLREQLFELHRNDQSYLSTIWKEIKMGDDIRQAIDSLPDRLRAQIPRVYDQCIRKQIDDLNKKKSSTPANATAAASQDYIGALKKLEDLRSLLGNALGMLADRRSQVRIVITSQSVPRDFFNLAEEMIFEIRLAPLTWTETWRWIRRNLPGLLRFGEDALARLWGSFGEKLPRWEELELDASKKKDQTPDLAVMAAKICPTPPSSARKDDEKRAGRLDTRALRVAVAGPHLGAPEKVAEAITRLAVQHGIGGHAGSGGTSVSGIAMIDEPSPFASGGAADDAAILRWLDRIIAQQPDIILLDFGWVQPTPKVDDKSLRKKVFERLHRSVLLIAAGGNKIGPGNMITFPSAFPEVLGVGPLDDDGKLRYYAEWHPKLNKPDLFMTDNLGATPLAEALKPSDLKRHKTVNEWGSSFSAIHAVATAILVWSLLPGKQPSEIRDLLIEAGEDIPNTSGARQLRIETAINKARRKLVEQTLEKGAAPMQTLAAITGFDSQILWSILEEMEGEGRVVRLTAGRLLRFQLI